MRAENLIKLRPHEQILKVVHEDFVPALPWWLFLFVWIAAPFFFLFPLLRQGMVGIVFLVILAGTGILMIFRSRYSWQRTVLVITDQRVVDISQRGFFDQEIAEFNHTEIKEVTYRIKGLLATVFRYGTIFVRTSDDRADIAFRRAHRPIDLNHLLNDLRQEAVSDMAALNRAQKLKALADRLSDREVERLAAAVKQREQQAAAKDFFPS